MRCKDCGDVRWSFMGFGDTRDATCVLCGGEMASERRHPHRPPAPLVTERREHDDVHDLARPPAAR